MGILALRDEAKTCGGADQYGPRSVVFKLKTIDTYTQQHLLGLGGVLLHAPLIAKSGAHAAAHHLREVDYGNAH
ncbi:hypothetical protein GEOBRER4_n1364 [Citrifermentans bremense]|uniref:Uncharacterized protein n=1 Tax=Citrifermentans bremense TaxID=60035 RepID=A0A6S6LY90_9BACT|nr:hypothetical protein GEOBRER4_n1364 [Citrifermentans bremense]